MTKRIRHLITFEKHAQNSELNLNARLMQRFSSDGREGIYYHEALCSYFSLESMSA